MPKAKAKKTEEPQKPQTLRDFFDKSEWEKLKQDEPMLDLLASASWQAPANFATLATQSNVSVDYFPATGTGVEKPSDLGYRDLQQHCWSKFKTFGPLNAAVLSKADYVMESGFSVYSDVYELNEWLYDLWFSFRNKLYFRSVGHIIRMMAEGELFLLIAFSDEGQATVRVLEPSRIGEADDKGLLTDPDDVSQTIFYKYNNGKTVELIPDARFVMEPEFMIERQKALGDLFKPEQISELTKGKKGGFGKMGGYRRFILHWKNTTGILEYLRDTSSLSTTLEWINLYIMALKWELDYKRALCAYTWEINFEDSATGKVAWHVWSKMTAEQRQQTGLLDPFSPGSKVFMMPGMTLKIHNPNLPSQSGSNQDLLNLSGSGARTPMDLWQGQSAGATYASVKSSRPPLVAEIENLQSKAEKFYKYELIRVCLVGKLMVSPSFKNAAGKSLKVQPVYDYKWVDKVEGGKPAIKKVKREAVEFVKFTWPAVRLIENVDASATASLGSKHAGIYSLGVSAETIARQFGIDDLSRERRRQLVEIEEYGEIKTGAEAEQMVEQPKNGEGTPADQDKPEPKSEPKPEPKPK